MEPAGPGLDESARRLSRRALLRLSVLTGLGAAAAACAGQSQPGWTYVPVASPSAGTPGSSSLPGASPASPTAAASDGGGGGGTVITIVAQTFKFDLAEFSVPANTPFRIVFDNQDAGVPHNVAIYDSGSSGPVLFKGEIFNGVRTVTYDVPGLPAGNHYFQCDVHPMMNGTVRAA